MSVHRRERINNRGQKVVSWRVFWLVEGQQKNKTFARERDARRYDRQVHLDLDKGSYVDPNEKMTVGEYAGYYLSTKAHAESSRKVYASYLRRINAAPLGGRPLGKVRPSEVQRWVSRLQDDGLASRTVSLMVS